MSLGVLLTVALTAAIQSIFGVGVLLFGTPLLLLQGYDFISALYTLLPISLTINLIQILQDNKHIDREFYKNILLFTIPFVVLFLFIVSVSDVDIGIVIGLFLLFVAIKNYSPKVEQAVDSLVKYEKTYFTVMGVVHGMTNLGGSLLTAIVHSKNYEKTKTRVTVAIAYATFAFFQLATLWLAAKSTEVNLGEIGLYWALGVLTYDIAEETLYGTIDNEKYRQVFAVFLFTSGILLIGKSF